MPTRTKNQTFCCFFPGFSLANRRWEWFKTHPDRTVAIDDSVEEQLPAPRRCHSVVQNGKFVFLMGG